MRLVGIDGCKAGWILATVDESLDGLAFEVRTELGDLIAGAAGGAAYVVIDVPIGLPQTGARLCDVAARALLRAPRTSSVFPTPCRPVLAAQTYEEACAISHHVSGKRVSRQLFGILPKVRSVDALMIRSTQTWVREAHPEVTFAVLAGTGRGLEHSKKEAAGEAERLALLRPFLGPIDVTAVRAALGRGKVARDDIVDALACLVTARRIHRGEAQVLPEGPVPLDARGLRMEIVA